MISILEEIKFAETGLLPALVSDYLKAEPALSAYYKYAPSLDAFAAVIADKSKDKVDRELLVEVLLEQYKAIPTTDRVMGNIKALADVGTFTIVAAHQPCLFLGPLYNIIKIAGAINLTRQLAEKYPVYRFVPVFWLGSEDHDIEELNHVTIEGKQYQWQTKVSGPVGRITSKVTEELLPMLKEQFGADNEVIRMLENGVEAYSTFGQFTQYLANELFKEQGLVVLDQDHPRFKQRFAPVIKDEVINQRAANLLKEHVELLESRYKVQAKPRDINFFYLGNGFRERILATDNGYKVNNRDLHFSEAQLLTKIDTHPENFSPNVILRPLYQEMLLPNLAFVGGAGELSYWLELKPVMEYYKVNYPMLVMRNSAFILPVNFQTKMQKAGVCIKDLLGNTEQLIAQRAKAQGGEDISLQAEKEAFSRLFEQVIGKAEAADTTLKQSAAGEKQKALNALETLEAKMLKAEKRKLETFTNQVQSLKQVMFPNGNLQERVESFVSFYEPGFMNMLCDTLNPLDFSLKVFVQTTAQS